jgi:hypothetical protein
VVAEVAVVAEDIAAVAAAEAEEEAVVGDKQTIN